MNELVISAATLGAALVVFLGWRTWRSSRRAQLRRIARTLGLERVADRHSIDAAEPLRRPPLGREPAQALELWRGELLGAELWALELAQAGAAPDPVVLLRYGDRPLPAFELVPRGGAETAPGFVFDGRDRFAELFVLRGEDEAAIRQLFRDEVVGFFERAENLSWMLVSAGGWIAIAVAPLGERRRRLDPKHFAGFVEDAKVLYRVLRGAPPRPRIGHGPADPRAADGTQVS